MIVASLVLAEQCATGDVGNTGEWPMQPMALYAGLPASPEGLSSTQSLRRLTITLQRPNLTIASASSTPITLQAMPKTWLAFAEHMFPNSRPMSAAEEAELSALVWDDITPLEFGE